MISMTRPKILGSILNHVLSKLFKVNGLYSSGRTRLIAIKILTKLHDLIIKDIFSCETEIEDVYDKLVHVS